MSEEELEDLLGLACCTYHKEIGRKANQYIKNMQKELQLKDKVINQMACTIYDYANLGILGICDCELEDGTIDIDLCKKEKGCNRCVSEYFINKVKGE